MARNSTGLRDGKPATYWENLSPGDILQACHKLGTEHLVRSVGALERGDQQAAAAEWRLYREYEQAELSAASLDSRGHLVSLEKVEELLEKRETRDELETELTRRSVSLAYTIQSRAVIRSD